MPSVKLPKEVRVGFRHYKVISFKEELADAENRYGKTIHSKSELHIDERYNPREIGNTFLHELLHCCFNIGGVGAADDEERIVTVLANQLSEIWQRNPKVIKYLNFCFGEEK